MYINGTFLFLFCLCFLIGGYFIYGSIAEKIMRPKASRLTPALSKCDGVDYTPLPQWKIFLIQLLNIAGLGPVYGAIMGALFGPIALIWITIGCIFFGAIHDYFAGMLSLRNGGMNLPEIISKYLGRKAMAVVRVLCIGLSILVGVVFAMGPAELLANKFDMDATWWLVAIFGYFFAATILPIGTIIGRFYPLFAICLLLMAGGMLGALLFSSCPVIPNCDISFSAHPKGVPFWPMIFVTIACGAISGFHATQSPLMARCITNQKHGKAMFFGPMVSEGVIALIWCTVSLSFYPTRMSLGSILSPDEGGPSAVVSNASMEMLGPVGSILALLGVVILPITTGDTALRSARLMFASSFKMSQKKISSRLLIAVPMFALAFAICTMDYSVIWRYFGWLNQCIACFTLVAISVFLAKTKRNYWVATIPAVFLTAVCITYGLIEKYCLNLPLLPSSIAACVASLYLVFYIRSKRKL